MKCSGKGLVILLIAGLAASCEQKKQGRPGPSGFSDESFSRRLRITLVSRDTAGKKMLLPISSALCYTYLLDEYQPIWLRDSFHTNTAAAKFIQELEDIRWDGLDPERYNLSALKRLKLKLDTTAKNPVEDAIAFDTALTRSYLAASRDLLVGKILPKIADSLWYHTNDSTWEAPQFLADTTGVYHPLEDFRSQVSTYALLRDEYRRYYLLCNDTLFRHALDKVRNQAGADSDRAVNIKAIIKSELPWLEPVPSDSLSDEAQLLLAFQGYSGIRQTGRLDSATLSRLGMPADSLLKKISANLERLRWMQKELGNLYLVVDVPLMELFLRKNEVNLLHMRVVVGRRERQTPSLYARMANIVINPSWGVPPTILRNDILPGLQKSGRKYLAKKGLRAYDSDGDAVDPGSINQRNYRRYTYKQAPGDYNSLGYVKFNLPNPWDIYLHDTPHRDDFVKQDRFLSSGCIRVQRPKEMAVFILSELERKAYTDSKLDSMIRTHKTRWEELNTRIPVHIVYLTAFEDTTGRHIRFTRDIYDRDNKLISLLN